MISPLFTTIVLVAGFIWVYMKITSKEVGKGTQELIEKERQANNTRRQPLVNLNYIDFNSSSIPFVDPAPNERINELQNTLKGLFAKKIVNLTGISNTDLKLTYGAANLPDLSEFDQNYTTLATCLYDLGVEFYNADLKDEAIAVLNYGISIGTDIAGNYIYLANIYVENQNYSEISKLIDKANFITSLTKASTISKLQRILDTHTAIEITPSTVDIPLNSTTADSELESVSVSPSSDYEDIPDNILPRDILDILETEPYKSDDQK